MKKTIILLLFLSQNIFGQDSTSKSNEIYLVIRSINDLYLNFQFKRQISDKLYMRFGVNDISINTNKNPNYSQIDFAGYKINDPISKQFSYNINLGIEKRIKFNEKLDFFFGSILIGNVNVYQVEGLDENMREKIYGKSRNSGLGIGLPFGGTVNLTKSLYLSTEFIPTLGISQNYSLIDRPDSFSKRFTNFNKYFSTNTQGLSIAIMYKFKK